MEKLKNKEKTSNIIGQITITSRGVGYLPNDLFKEDIEIPNNYTNTALNKDTVEIVLHPKIEGERIRGEVVKIIERAKTRFVGVVEKEDGLLFLAPDDKRMYISTLCSPDSKVENGIKVLAELTHWSDPKKNPEGKIIKILGKKGEHNVEMQAIVFEHGFEADFPSYVERAAAEIENKKRDILQAEIGRRKDFRSIMTMTIDPPDAKDFDDAISIKNLKNGNIEVGVHIADVSHYVTPGEDKLTYSAVFELTKNGDVKNRWFGETIINSKKRFTYEDAQKTINAEGGEYYEELDLLNKIAKILRKKRFDNGSIEFEHDEVKFTLDENG